MEHVVFFPAPDGTPAFRRFAGLDEAVRFVEHLRNVENVSEASVHSLTEVPLSFKTWYRVEVPAETTGVASALAAPTAPAVEQRVDAASADVVAAGTIAEAIETYTHPAAHPASDEVFTLPGSATGIVVPDQPMVAVDQFSAPTPLPPVPSAGPAGPAAALAAPAPMAATAADVAQPDVDAQAQILEPAFGARRDRGMGFFAR